MYRYANNLAFPYALQQDYEKVGMWPEKGVDIDEKTFSEFFFEKPPEGKERKPGKKGRPQWVDV